MRENYDPGKNTPGSSGCWGTATRGPRPTPGHANYFERSRTKATAAPTTAIAARPLRASISGTVGGEFARAEVAERKTAADAAAKVFNIAYLIVFGGEEYRASHSPNSHKPRDAIWALWVPR